MSDDQTIRVLLAGESWTSHTIHVKGFDSFTTSEYAEGGTQLIASLERAGMVVDYLPNHHAARDFPTTLNGLYDYQVVLLSDIGSNTLLLHPDTFSRSRSLPDRCELLREFVEGGGGLGMIGGYLSFSGIDGKARYQRTAIADLLPVQMVDGDDRVECPQGVAPDILDSDHPIFTGLDGDWPTFLGYNQLRAAGRGQTLANVGDDVFIAVAEIGRGRTAIFASDCGPHWGPPEFVQWKHYGRLWSNFTSWLAGR